MKVRQPLPDPRQQFQCTWMQQVAVGGFLFLRNLAYLSRREVWHLFSQYFEVVATEPVQKQFLRIVNAVIRHGRPPGPEM